MTRFNTGNPVGSADPRDRDDNSKNLDELINGGTAIRKDRLGKNRKTWYGMEGDFVESQSRREDEYISDQKLREERFNAFMAASGNQFAGDYAPGIEITEYNQLVRDGAGEFWRLSGAESLPYITSGAGLPEGQAFIPVGDAAIRQELRQGGGSGIVGFGSRTVQEKLSDNITPLDDPYLAKGDGVSDDSAAFVNFESDHKGKVVDLLGRTFHVSYTPMSNNYINGFFVKGGFNVPSSMFSGLIGLSPRYHKFGGQIGDLKLKLSDPLCQFVGVVFVGDSITWGSGATGTGLSLPPRDGTLSDPRSTYGAPSFVNQVKRYLRDNYRVGDDASEVISNWDASSVGESTAIYRNVELLYPRYGQFTVQKLGASQEPADLTTNSSPSGMILSLNNTVESEQYGHSISFPFTGKRFIISIRTSLDGALDAYLDVLINGVVNKTVNLQPGQGGILNDNFNYDQQIEVEIPYVNNGIVTLRTNRNGLPGQRLLSVTALRVPRELRVTNNGIVGASSVTYRERNLAGNVSGDGVAIADDDEFVFVQLGTNDRGWVTGRPRGSNQYEDNFNMLLDNNSFSGKRIILMAANPSGNEDPETYSFHMQEVRNIIYRVASQRKIDMIDNYSIFNGLENSSYTSDGLHPNDIGHTMIARNIINSLELST